MSPELLSELTLEEKAALLSGDGRWRTKGIPRLGIKAVKLSDGPNGVRGEAIHDPSKATCFPCLSCIGATFNTDLSVKIGECLAIEAKLKNAGVVLGPTMNIQRHPFGGRGFESYSEDVVLTGELAAAYVNGLQSKGIGASPKHLACNECELFRTESDSIVDDVTLRELYLLPFQICLKKAKPWTIMAAYNKLNGESCTENSWLLTQLLHKEWGFEGLTMSK